MNHGQLAEEEEARGSAGVILRPTVLALDPGGTTGYALFGKRTRMAGDKYTLCDAGDFPTWEGLLPLIGRLPKGKSTVVYEQIYVGRASFNPIGLEVIGVIKYLCRERRIALVPQSPQVITGIKKWKKVDVSFLQSQHAKDAFHHGAMYLGVHNVVQPKRSSP